MKINSEYSLKGLHKSESENRKKASFPFTGYWHQPTKQHYQIEVNIIE